MDRRSTRSRSVLEETDLSQDRFRVDDELSADSCEYRNYSGSTTDVDFLEQLSDY